MTIGNYARLDESGAVINVELWDSEKVPDGLVLTTDASIGWTYDHATKAFSQPAATPLTIDQLCDLVTSARDAKINNGYDDAVTGKMFACDPVSIGKWDAIGAAAGLAMLMQIKPAPTFDLIAADNMIITLSAKEAFDLLQGRVMPWVSATFIYARRVKDAILAGTPQPDYQDRWPQPDQAPTPAPVPEPLVTDAPTNPQPPA